MGGILSTIGGAQLSVTSSINEYSVDLGAERQHWHARRDVLRMEEYLEKTLAFSGAPE